MDDLGQSGWLAAARSDASPRRCERKLPALLLRELEARRAPKTAGGGRSLRREAVGEFPGSDDFLYINDKKSILRWAISV